MRVIYNTDKFGVKLKHMDRHCTMCNKYPCFPEITKCICNFAAYGCLSFEEKRPIQL